MWDIIKNKNVCFCNVCNKKIKQGFQCGFLTIENNLWFDKQFCDEECMSSYFNQPHIFMQEYVQYFYDKKLTDLDSMKEKDFIKKYPQHRLLGPPFIPDSVRQTSKNYDMVSRFITGLPF